MSDEGKRSVAWSTTVPSGGQGYFFKGMMSPETRWKCINDKSIWRGT